MNLTFADVMYKVGIAGGIGCGKSNIVHAFAALGVPVYKADDEAKRLNEESPDIRKFLINLLGEEVYMNDGHLNKPYMAARIFSDSNILQQVNSTIHEEVRKDFLSWAERQCSSGAKYVVCEAAVMIQSNFYKMMDMLIVADLDLETRIQRTVKRDNSTREQILARLNKQLPQQELIKYANVVLNTDDHTHILDKILNIHTSLTNL
ncbi:MAG: dephospho-CoA kinase [Bacteroidales bacterium]|nr:dephospho-CoA kinase [Bacteroidales bacterium]